MSIRPRLFLRSKQRSLHISRRSSRVDLGLRRLALVGHPELKQFIVCITPWTCSVASAPLHCSVACRLRLRTRVPDKVYVPRATIHATVKHRIHLIA